MDLERVGIYGHSGGGFMSTAAMLVYPDFFKVAVSSSGNHDNSMYNRWWSETHHGVKEVTSNEGEVSFEYAIEKNQDLARNYGIHPVQIRLIEKDEIKFKNAYMGLVLIHGDLIEKVPAIVSTDGLEYQLTTAFQKMNNKISTLLALPEKIQVDLYMSSSLKEVAPMVGLKSLASLPEKIEKAVGDPNRNNYGKLAYHYFDPTTDPDKDAEAEKYNLRRLKWPDLSGGRVKGGGGCIGMVMRYGKKVAEVPLLNVMQLPLIGTHYELVDIEDLDEIINENVESLIDINENIGFLADHGTLSLFEPPSMNPLAPPPESLSTFNSLVSRNYSIQSINLKEDSIPESLGCLIVARPTEKFSDYALYQIDQFLMRGKSLAVFLDSFKEVRPPGRQPFGFNQGPTYVPADTGLQEMLAHYGVRVKQSYVLDESCYKQNLPQRMGGGERPIYFAPMIKNENINDDLDFMKNIKGLVAMRISPLEAVEGRIKEDGLTAHKLLSSSDRSWEMRGRINLNPMMIRPPASEDDMASMPLSYLVTGQFTSYFKGKPIPEKPAEEKPEEGVDIEELEPEKKEPPKPDEELAKIQESGGFIERSKPAKIFVLASAEVLTDNMMDEEGKTPNATFIMNVIDDLNGRDDIAAMRSKEQQFNPLHETGAATKTTVKVFNIAGLPALVVLFGFFVLLKRRARRKQIQLMFQK